MDEQQNPHDSAFRVRAVRRIIESGSDLHQVAAELDVIPKQLSAWLRQYAIAGETDKGTWRMKTSTERVQELRRESECLKQELDQLKQITSVSRGFIHIS
jgi:transposase-like protein